MGYHGVLTGHVPTRQGRLKPTAKGSRIAEPSRDPHGNPANREPAYTILVRTG